MSVSATAPAQTGLFREPAHFRSFEERGYAVAPLLSEEEVEKLLEIYFSLRSGIDPGYYASIDSPDTDYKRETDIRIREIIEEPLQRVLEPFDLMTGSFIVKQPGKQSLVYVHTDWTFADEADGQPLVAWIPLHDVGAKNGALEVVEGSHRFVPLVRGPGIPNTLLPYHKFLRRKYARLQPMRAGEGMFFKSNLIHCSPVNRTDEVRVAIRIEILPKDRPMIICHQDERRPGKVDVYRIRADFFTTYVKGDTPDGELLETIDHIPPEFSKRRLRQYLKPYY